jgi:hypothetical protein
MRCLITWLTIGALVIGAGGTNAAEKALVPSGETRARYAESLVNILETTESIDAFVTTLRLLEKTKEVQPEQLLPVIIRNAERVGIFGHYIGEDQGGATNMAELVMEYTVKMAKKHASQAKSMSCKGAGDKPAHCIAEGIEDNGIQKSDVRTPIAPPIRPGSPEPRCQDQPTEAEVFRALPNVPHGIPYLYESFRDNAQIVFERIVDKVDSPRFFPLVGAAQLHHCHWKCTVSFTEVIELNYPFPCRACRPRVEVIYIDKDYLHAYNVTSQTKATE